MTLMSLFHYFLLMDLIAGTHSGSLANYIFASWLDGYVVVMEIRLLWDDV